MKETVIAYPRLKRDWTSTGGYVLRLRPPGVKGIPDFALFHEWVGTVMCEVKCQPGMNDKIGIDELQVDMLRKISKHGGLAFCLAFCLMNSQWMVFPADRVNVDTKWSYGVVPCHTGYDLLERMR
jgi:hypothetical protein